MKNNKKGSAYAWILVLLGVLIVSVAYIAFTPAFTGIYDAIVPAHLTGDYTTTAERLQDIWYIWPIIMISG